MFSEFCGFFPRRIAVRISNCIQFKDLLFSCISMPLTPGRLATSSYNIMILLDKSVPGSWKVWPYATRGTRWFILTTIWSISFVINCHVFYISNLPFSFLLETTTFLSSKLSTMDIAHILALRNFVVEETIAQLNRCPKISNVINLLNMHILIKQSLQEAE